ncbi:hypothetical protein J3E72DRAFT_292457 [Bipolaris maydis]|uniref:uncharacterized protein n=1 Tax=Cochliobolus heterostrophus TaxID=5016 RepID=UPI0024DC84C5|nr:hypothetical protein J3E73DRAFT_270842 [Bipolaris maydis]KAJ5060047.1 hypothetical protein J3E74DRAFT_341315 [Bipolaris maydis]KAJ6202156.1 hypothetical protein J3E72DRAFT_292457 [Bipolaris maydis]KAJ6273247.1 hypothetical protein PSV08DRAFT_272590 [Bipolaris maydis]KAJ6284457.1 hypothetical protein J3E71DRAFT_264909 [Bipolaris maydis]
MYTGWHFWFIYVNSFCVYFCFFYSRPSCFGHLRYQCRSLFCLFYTTSAIFLLGGNCLFFWWQTTIICPISLTFCITIWTWKSL